MSNFKKKMTRSLLDEQLKKLDKERKAELRRMESSSKRFHIKCLKKNPYRAKNEQGNSSFQMYETHCPGFCYHRNGECRIPDISRKEKPSVSQTQHIVNRLVLTNGEVDICKVLCLHLLAVQSLPVREENECCQVVLEEELPRLPMCVLNIKDGSKESEKTKTTDGEKLFVNVQLGSMLRTVLETLQNINAKKIEELQAMCNNAQAVEDMFAQPSIQKFLDCLCGRFFVSSYEMFKQIRMSGSAAVVLEVNNVPESLKRLVGEIKYNLWTQCPVCEENESFGFTGRGRVKEIAQLKCETFKSLLRPSQSQKNLFIGVESWKARDKKYQVTTENQEAVLRRRVGDCYACRERLVSTSASRTTKSKLGTSTAAIRQFLRKMSNEDRILVGLSAAGLKSWRVNEEVTENSESKISLAAIVIPVLAIDSKIKKKKELSVAEYEVDDDFHIPEEDPTSKTNLTVETLTKMKHEIAIRETDKKLKHFLNTNNP